MSIYDTIETAVTAAENMIKNGSNVNDAVAKASSGLNRETVKRVVENVNVNAFCKLLKSGEDRTKEFPVADAKIVMEKLGDTVVNDLDLNKTTVPDMAYYKEPAIKTSSQKRFDKSIPKCQMDMYKLAHQNLAKRQAELYRDAINECQDVVVDNMYKIASYMTANQAKADELFGNVKLKYGNKFDFLIDNICKNARVKCGSYKRKIFDDTNTSVQLFDQLVDALEKQSLLKKKADNFLASMGSAISPYLRNIHDRDRYSAEYGGPSDMPLSTEVFPPEEGEPYYTYGRSSNWRPATEVKARIIDVVPGWPDESSSPTVSSKSEEESGGKWQKFKDKAKEYSKWTDEYIREAKKRKEERVSKRTPFNKTIFGSTVLDTLKASLASGKEKYKEYQEEIKGERKISDKYEQVLKQQKVFGEMLHEDPIISQQDPKVVAALYKQLAKIAPKVSTMPEIVRSFLRQVTSQSEPTLDAVTAKEIVKLELALTGKTDEAL